MANWLHSGWRQESGAAAQLVKLDLHLTELSDAVSANVTKGASSRDSASLNQMIADLRAERERLVVIAARQGRGGLRRVRFM
jgi:hypothetical protein